jgi:hypothetical protein
MRWVFDDTLVLALMATVLIVVTLSEAPSALMVLATVALTFAIQAALIIAPALSGGW